MFLFLRGATSAPSPFSFKRSWRQNGGLYPRPPKQPSLSQPRVSHCHFHCDFLRYHVVFLYDNSMQSKDEIVKVFRGYQQELGRKSPLKFHLRVIYWSRLHPCCPASALCAQETFFPSRRDRRSKSCSFLSVAGIKQFVGNGSRINL